MTSSNSESVTQPKSNVSAPTTLFKFFSIRQTEDSKEYNSNLITSIRDSYLWFSKPSNFNDPYDCYGNLITYDLSSKEHARTVAKFIVNNSSKLSRTDRRKEIKQIQKDPIAIRQAYLNTRQATIESQGICCFSRTRSNTLMWSHYANCHTGLCLEFDAQQLQCFYDIHRVNYTNRFTPLNYFDNPIKALVKLFTTKSIDWQYEEEYRAIKDGSGRSKFPKSSLIGVTFGCKTSKEDKNKIQNECLAVGYNHIQWSEAHMQENSFNLNFKPLS